MMNFEKAYLKNFTFEQGMMKIFLQDRNLFNVDEILFLEPNLMYTYIKA